MKNLRNILAAALLAVAWLVPQRSEVPHSPVQPADAPSQAMQDRVAGVAAALSGATGADRAVWIELWKKAALIAASDELTTQPILTTTELLRRFNVLSVNIAWRRLNANQPGKYAGLAEATEKAFADTLGIESKPVTKDMRASYVELCNALAWAGSPKE